jgi:hypothetical protein
MDLNPSPVANSAEFIIGRRFAPTRWLIRATLSDKGRGEEGTHLMGWQNA